MGLVGIFSTLFLASADAEFELPVPEDMERPALIADQPGVDLAWKTPKPVDYPNGAWGLEIVVPSNGSLFVSPRLPENFRWVDLATLSLQESNVIQNYLDGLEAYRQGNPKQLESSGCRDQSSPSMSAGSTFINTHVSYISQP